MVEPGEENPAHSKRSKPIDRTAIASCLAAFLFLIVSQRVHVKPITMKVAAIAPVDNRQPKITGEGFGPRAVPLQTSSPSIQGQLEFYGSYLGGDASTGTIRTQWYGPTSGFYLYVCGYPLNREASLFLEIDREQAGAQQLRLDLD